MMLKRAVMFICISVGGKQFLRGEQISETDSWIEYIQGKQTDKESFEGDIGCVVCKNGNIF